MNVRTSRNFRGLCGILGLGMLLYIPCPFIDRFRHTQIERQLLDDLPSETQVRPAAKPVPVRLRFMFVGIC